MGNLEILHIYTRVSSKSQNEDGTSIETQKDVGIQKSIELGMDYKVWNEGGASSKFENLTNRPILTHLMGEVENGNIDHMFAYNNDRLSGNDITQQTIKIACQKKGVILYTKNGRYDLSNPTDKFVKTLLDGVAEYDNAIRSERTKTGRLTRVKQGFWYGAPLPYGSKLKIRNYLQNH